MDIVILMVEKGWQTKKSEPQFQHIYSQKNKLFLNVSKEVNYTNREVCRVEYLSF